MRIHNLSIFQDFFRKDFYNAVFISEQIPVILIFYIVHINIMPLGFWDGKHIVQIQDGKSFYFQKIHRFLHLVMFFLELRQRNKIIQTIYAKHYSDIFSGIWLMFLLVMKQMWSKRQKVIDVFRIYLVELNHNFPFQKKNKGNQCPCC